MASKKNYLYILPALIIYFIFLIVPIFFAIFASFLNWSPLAPLKFEYIGLHNFNRMMGDWIFWHSLKNTVILSVLTVVFELLIGLLLAVGISKIKRGSYIYLALYAIPLVIPVSFVGILWAWMCNPHIGMLDWLFDRLGIFKQGLLGDPQLAFPTVVVSNIWRWIGFSLIIYFAALQQIPEELYEAARIDGAKSWDTFRHITLPLLKPTTIILIILVASGAAFMSFDLVFNMTDGGPGYSTYIAPLYIYKQCFYYGSAGYASALSAFMFIILLVFTVAYLKITKFSRILG